MLVPIPEKEPDRKTVEQFIKDWSPDWERIMKEMRWSSIDGCWYIDIHGMLVGIETDGYIHS
jgi:hypothetical protein